MLKAVGESVKNPLAYYDVNVTGAAVLLQAMDQVGCRQIVFSSSATVCGEPKYLPLDVMLPQLFRGGNDRDYFKSIAARSDDPARIFVAAEDILSDNQ